MLLPFVSEANLSLCRPLLVALCDCPQRKSLSSVQRRLIGFFSFFYILIFCPALQANVPSIEELNLDKKESEVEVSLISPVITVIISSVTSATNSHDL